MDKKINVVPAGFQSVNLYLIAEGAGRLLEFLKQGFGAEEKFRSPQPDGSIMHAEVRVGDTLLEAADAAREWKAMPGNLHYYVRNVDEVYRRAVEAGATPLYEPREMEYGDREAGVRDVCGNNWFIATHKSGSAYRPEQFKDVTPGLSLKDAKGFLGFVEKAFGAAIVESSEAKNGAIAHGVVRIGDTALELSEAHGEWAPRPVALHYYVENCDDIFLAAVAAGATATSEPADKPYGERSGNVRDAWGNHWFIATRTEMPARGGLDEQAKAQSGQ